MCWGEKIISTCPYCQVSTTHPPNWLGCPFEQPIGSCVDAFVTVHHAIEPHHGCVPTFLGIPRPQLRVNTDLAEPWDAGSPHYSPMDDTHSTTRFHPPTEPPAYSLPLPHGWTADYHPESLRSDCMTMVLQYRIELIRIFQDLVQPVQQLRSSASFTNPRLSQLTIWVEDFIMNLVLLADTYVWRVQQAEDQIANNTPWADTARADILIISNDVRRSLVPFELPTVWHRRFTDLFIHLRRVIGELTPQPAQDTAFLPTHRRRGAISEGDGTFPVIRGGYPSPADNSPTSDHGSDSDHDMDS